MDSRGGESVRQGRLRASLCLVPAGVDSCPMSVTFCRQFPVGACHLTRRRQPSPLGAVHTVRVGTCPRRGGLQEKGSR